ncbi:MAG: hypothetical protein KBA97_05070 [Methanothrix sp.]|nr:hypothetical protein [Methanothrix sp.]
MKRVVGGAGTLHVPWKKEAFMPVRLLPVVGDRCQEHEAPGGTGGQVASMRFWCSLKSVKLPMIPRDRLILSRSQKTIL